LKVIAGLVMLDGYVYAVGGWEGTGDEHVGLRGQPQDRGHLAGGGGLQRWLQKLFFLTKKMEEKMEILTQIRDQYIRMYVCIQKQEQEFAL
jgi:hypothetical protein